MRAEEFLGIEPGYGVGPPGRKVEVEPPPFDIENLGPPIATAAEGEDTALSLWPLVRPFIATGYSAASALNRGMAGFSEGLGAVRDFVQRRQPEKWRGKLSGDLDWSKIADDFDGGREYWKERADKVGISFMDELVGEAVGGAIPGIGEFILNVPWAVARGAAVAERAGENPMVGALTEGAKRGILGQIFRAIHPLRQYLRAPIFGGVFGVEAAATGAPPEEIAKSFGTGAIYSLSSPGGVMGLNEVRRNLKRYIPERRIEVAKKDVAPVETEEISKGKERLEKEVEIPRTRLKLVAEGEGYEGEPLYEYDVTLKGKRIGGFQWLEFKEGELSFTSVGIEPAYRGKGYFRDIILAARNEAVRRKATKLVYEPAVTGEGITDAQLAEALGRYGFIEPRPGIMELRIVEEPRLSLLEEFPDRKGEPPEVRDRKYWKTVEEAERTEEGAKIVMKEAQKKDPKINITMPNRESLDKAYRTLEEKGFEDTTRYTYTDPKLKPVEKGALFNVLMEDAQKRGDWGKFTEVMDNYSLYLVDLGRGVQIASVWNRSTPMGFLKWSEKQLDNVNKKLGWSDALFGRKRAALTAKDKAYIAEEFIRVQKMPESAEKSADHLKLVDFVAQKVPPSISELVDAFRYQNMLCGFQTQERNIGWNMTNTFLWRPYELAIKGSIDYMKSGLRGKGRQAYVRDVPVYYKDLINAVPNAITAFKNSWGMKPGEVMGKPELGIVYKTPFELARAKQLPKAITVVQRFMEGSDRFNSTLISAAEYAALKKRGWSDAEAYMRAQQLAERFLLRDKLDPGDPTISYFSKILEGVGLIIQKGRKLPAIGKPLGWFVPFIRTPIKVGVRMVERSPLGWARPKIDQDSLSRLVGGGIVTGIGGLFAYLGEVTWAPPSDPVQKEWFYASGRKPFSVKVGEKYVPLWYLGPFALAFAFPAAIKYYTEETKQSMTDDAFDMITKIAEGIARFISSQTSAQSIGNFFAMMSGEIDAQIKNQLGFTLGQIIPFQAMIRYINKALDPIYRKSEGVWEQMMRDIPFLSENLPARYTPFMEESKRELFNMLLPYDVGVEKEEYSELYNWILMERRATYLDGQMGSLIEKMDKGDFRDKHLEEMERIFNAAPKVFEGGGK